FPVEIRHRAQITLARLDREPAHRIEVVLSGNRVPPQDVVLAVAVEVADSCHLPVLVGHRADVSLPTYGGSVHEIDIVLASRDVAPQNIRPPIAVEVAGAGDGPAQVRYDTQVPFARHDRCAVHRVDVVLAGRSIAPQDVRAAVGGEIGSQRDAGA